MSPKRTIEILAAVALAALPLAAVAQDEAPKRVLPQFTHSQWCAPGYAPTFVLQCDPGSRAPVDQVWNPVGVGLEICAATRPTCEPVRNLNPNARPGFEVMDSATGDLVVVGFGLDRLLGVAP
jgi:hypothetical protein